MGCYLFRQGADRCQTTSFATRVPGIKSPMLIRTVKFGMSTRTQVVALVIEGKLYSTYGEFLGHLENSDNVQSGTAPESFMKLLKTRT